jgi:hypothetical protein
MMTPASRRAEVWRCLEGARNTFDPAVERQLSARAPEMAQQAEALERRAAAATSSTTDSEKKQG